MNLLTITLLAALSWYQLPDGSYRQLDDRTSLPGKFKAVKVAGEREPVFVEATNITDRCADPVFAERYAAAWDLAATAQAYGATNATKGANIYRMAAVASAATNADHRAAIQSDADRMNAIEEWLSRYGGWESFLNRYETNITTRTEWRPAE